MCYEPIIYQIGVCLTTWNLSHLSKLNIIKQSDLSLIPMIDNHIQRWRCSDWNLSLEPALFRSHLDIWPACIGWLGRRKVRVWQSSNQYEGRMGPPNIYAGASGLKMDIYWREDVGGPALADMEAPIWMQLDTEAKPHHRVNQCSESSINSASITLSSWLRAG